MNRISLLFNIMQADITKHKDERSSSKSLLRDSCKNNLY
jgi:uncharacterized tellurite resistance protein B-like protein